ncbi:protoporphyrinogen/coproporphyrinogen oxidase [Microbacterium dextranolyticum]|uniref:Protoporphyrinogen oxidase n=1 Tax=Microbacterium dextranolyticum TaxID=36806 RepID=A0A9W6M518_9MICO|nr:FAD-dependent oxidoreductase [Microbacterium dextranolyticum]MBM7461931.1 oxygen-dependent protoporphyrinogen oxidase [Microbacterium dextranolyticum]GLJ94170.1 protoporphyrinogen oxidase [Microbacterium dextranolyticum]
MTEHVDPDLAGRAAATRVVVVGGGIAGLVAAWECARIGMPVTLLEATGRLGGSIETVRLDGIAVDLVADAVPRGPGALADLIDDLGLRELVEPAATEVVAIAAAAPNRPAGAVQVTPLPQHLAGIPANTWAEPVRRIVGAAGVWRAYLDRLRPPLTIGRQRSLGDLVRTRMGARVRDRMVAPLSVGLYGVEPELVDADLAVPGLSAALTRAGSLSGAVGQLLPDAPSGDGTDAGATTSGHPRRGTLRGGLSTLVSALTERLRDLDVDIRLDAPVVELRPLDDGWAIRTSTPASSAGTEGAGSAEEGAGAPVGTTADGGADRAAGAEASGSPTPTDMTADIVVLAATAGSIAALLTTLGVRVEVPVAPVRDVVTLVTDAATPTSGPDAGRAAPALVCAVPGASAAATLVDAAAMWPSVAAAAGPERRVLRVALVAGDGDGDGGGDDDDDGYATGRAAGVESDAALVARAYHEAVAVFGSGVGEVRAAAHRRVTLMPPASTLDHADRATSARAAVARLGGVAAVGSWLSGGGLATVVGDTVEEIESVRRETLFGRH